MLRLIGRDRTVLDIGRSSDAVAEALAAQGCPVTRIEPDRLDAVAEQRFDVVLVDGVLEHAREPVALLAKAAALLTGTGHLVVSVPNVAHGSVRLALLEGRWNGTTDLVRMFTWSTAEALFGHAGLRVERTERVISSPFDVDPLLNLGNFPSAVVEMVADDPESATERFVVVAVPATRPQSALDLVPEPALARAEAVPRPVPEVAPDWAAHQARVDGVRAVAFYLPQFHPIPENDAWWGGGFTEWANVTRAKPMWPGHYQPRRPTELGFYDLRVPEVRERQAALARAHGISAFIYHHYWFSGRRLLNRPFDEVLESGSPELPFALCWANESWSRVWDGDHSVLVEQTYDGDEMRRHAAWLAKPFNDPRYLRVDDRPVFVIYRVSHLDDPRRYVEAFRAACVAESGLNPYLVQAVTHDLNERPAETGCDAEVEFPPHRIGDRAHPHVDPVLAARSHLRYEYDDVAQGCVERLDVPWVRHPCVVPSWDNTARRKVRATILQGANPEAYEKWLSAAAEHEAGRRPDNGLVFVNAWNEWAEGAYLEPDEHFGLGYLEATRRVFGALPPSAREATGRAAGATPADYLVLRERLVAVEREIATAFARGEKVGRTADQRQAVVYRREVDRLLGVIADLQAGAAHMTNWVGHMQAEIDAKNQVMADAETYCRHLEAELAAKNDYLAALERANR